jgi:presenilin-like A22 family membrane protease
MDINSIFNKIVTYVQANPVVSATTSISMLILLFWRPKIFFILISIVAVAYGLAILFGKLAETGLG